MSACASSKRLVVLLSGAGSNLRAILSAITANQLEASVALVISDRADAGGLAIAAEHSVPCQIFERARYGSKARHEQAYVDAILQQQPDLIILAGFMRVISADALARIGVPMLNLHPSLLPKYPGLDTHQRALDAGDVQHGASVHFVTAQLDGGPILAQARLPIQPDETALSLAQRLKPLEHKLLIASALCVLEKRVLVQLCGISVDGINLSAPMELQNDGQLQAV